jgi:hypothetical protein
MAVVMRSLAISAGATAIAASAALNVTHLVDGGQPLFSPLTGAVVALALGAVAAALVASEAWRSGRKLLAWCLVLSVVAGEGFGLVIGAERLLFAREERQRMASEVNTTRWIAVVRVESATSTLAATEAAVLEEARRGGCKAACQALQAEAEQARQRLEAANRTLEATPAEKKHGATRHDPRTFSGAPGDRAGAAVLNRVEWACIHVAGLRRPRA